MIEQVKSPRPGRTAGLAGPGEQAVLKRLRLVAGQAPLSSLPISTVVARKASTLGFSTVHSVRSVSWEHLVRHFGEPGAREIKAVLSEYGLGGHETDD